MSSKKKQTLAPSQRMFAKRRKESWCPMRWVCHIIYNNLAIPFKKGTLWSFEAHAEGRHTILHDSCFLQLRSAARRQQRQGRRGLQASEADVINAGFKICIKLKRIWKCFLGKEIHSSHLLDVKDTHIGDLVIKTECKLLLVCKKTQNGHISFWQFY